MRLLVVTQYFWPEDFRVNELVAELTRRGHEVTILTGRPNYPGGTVFPEYRKAPREYAEYHGARVLRAPVLARGRGSARLVLNYLSFVVAATATGVTRLRARPFDAIFVFEPSPITVCLPAIALRRLTRRPVVLWVLDQWPETLAAVGVVKSKRLLRYVGRLVEFIYARCDVILAPSRSLVDTVRKYCDERKPVVYFPNWAESVYANGDVAAAPEIPAWSGFTVMFAGNIGEAQDFPAILDAAESLKDRTDIRWVIVGDGRAAAWVKKEVIRRGLESSVLLPGRYPVDRMPSFYRHADALLVSLKTDPIFDITIPGKVQSYLAAGVPVLGMLNGDGAQVIAESGAGLTSPSGDAAALAENVRRMSAMSLAARKEMAASGTAYAAREFERASLIGKLEGLLMDVARSRPVTED